MPVRSPLSLRALARAGTTPFRRHHDERERLATLLRDDFAADGASLTDSGTAALQLAIRAALRTAGGAGIVALPAFTCYDVATAAVGADAGIALYDIVPDTLAPDTASLDAAFRCGARAAVIAPLHGVPVDWDAIAAIAADHGAVLIEDAAQGHAARWRDRPLGSLGPISVLSFGRGKGWTGGAGGALLWRGDDPLDVPAVAPARAAARAIAGATAQWALGRPALYALPAALPFLGLGDTVYRSPAPPAAMPAAVAALVLATRDLARREGDARRDRGLELRARLGGDDTGVRIPHHGLPGMLRLPILLPHHAADTAAALRHLGVATAYPTTLGELPAVQARRVAGNADAPMPGAAALVRQLVTVPAHGLLSAPETDVIVATLAAALRGARPS